MNWKPSAIALALLALAGCDSGLAYQADLGQHATAPLVELTVGTPTAAGQTLTFAPSPGNSLPSEWLGARSLKVGVGTLFYPMASAATGSLSPQSMLVAQVVQAPFLSKPLNSSESTMSFLINGDHVMAARVSFK